jgi:hypothetical protein
MNIHKKFLSKKKFKNMQDFMMGLYFPWYFIDCVSIKDDGFFQFEFLFFKDSQNCSQEYMDLIQPILSKLKYKKLLRVKANLLTQTNKTSIFYINNCNGYTKFKNGEKIISEENKLVEFNSTLEHSGSSCTDQKRRVVINFNYQ